jgi:predicted acylesterase/phospholipase RssA
LNSAENEIAGAVQAAKFRILSLDGGGAKGFYTLGVLKEIEGMIGCPLYQRFDLVFGTSIGVIIAALICLGYSVDAIHELYKEHVVTIMAEKTARAKTAALERLATEVFGETKFDAIKTGIGIVTTKGRQQVLPTIPEAPRGDRGLHPSRAQKPPRHGKRNRGTLHNLRSATSSTR